MSRETLQADEFTDLQTQKRMNSQTHEPMNPKAHELINSNAHELTKTQRKDRQARQTKLVSLELFENSNTFLWVGVRTEQTLYKPQQAKIHLIGVNDEELSHVFAVYAIQTWVV